MCFFVSNVEFLATLVNSRHALSATSRDRRDRRQHALEFSDRNAESVLIPQLSIRSVVCVASATIPESVLRQKYLKNQLSMRDIARELACSKTHTRDLLLKYNIPYVNRTYATTSGIPTVSRVGGKTIDHKAELRIIATIKQMYRGGNSTHAIAGFLNTMKIPTKNQGKGWRNCTVAKILEREGTYIVG